MRIIRNLMLIEIDDGQPSEYNEIIDGISKTIFDYLLHRNLYP